MDLLVIAVWIVVGAAAVGLAWSLLADRPRGRLRCPKCWYTIDLRTRTECPECGRAIANERQLNRTRRHPWRSGAFVLVLCLAFYGTTCIESIRRDGWLGVVPTIVLIAISDGEEAWKWQGATPPNRAVAVLLDRMEEHRSSLWSRRWWASKAAGAMPEIPPPRMPIEVEPTVVRTYDLSAFAPLVSFRDVELASFVGAGPMQVLNDRHTIDAWEIVTNIRRFEAWQMNGGVEAWSYLIGDQLIIRASQSHHAEIAATIAVLSDPPRRVREPFLAAGEGLVVMRYELPILVPKTAVTAKSQEDLLRFRDGLQLTCRQDLWQTWGGMDAQLHVFRDSFVIETTADHHKEIAAFIDAKAATMKSSD
ncbi:MAG: hypothetical protein AAFY46_10315 [Planctomycetota bacterium]